MATFSYSFESFVCWYDQVIWKIADFYDEAEKVSFVRRAGGLFNGETWLEGANGETC